jgi:hypothetical protein
MSTEAQDHPLLYADHKLDELRWYRGIGEEEIDDNVFDLGLHEITNLDDNSSTTVGYHARAHHPTPDADHDEVCAFYMRMDYSVDDFVYGFYFEIPETQGPAAGSAIKIMHRGKGDAVYVGVFNPDDYGVGYEAAMFKDGQQGFIATLQGSGGFAASVQNQQYCVGFEALTHDDGTNPFSGGTWATAYGMFYANNSIANAFLVRVSPYATLTNPQMRVTNNALRSVWEVLGNGETILAAPASTNVSTPHASPKLRMRGTWYSGGEGYRDAYIYNDATASTAQLKFYLGAEGAETLIANMMETGLVMNNLSITGASTLKLNDVTSTLNLNGGAVNNSGTITATGSADLYGFTNLFLLGTTIMLGGRRTITNHNDSGNDGDFCWDTNYAYFGIGGNSWKRVALSSW